ncbi:MAG TPA: hypothetical protein VFY14_10305 [Streptomyces sp.]|nr:hypothetical protein [Streptomyces sp.]
MFRTTLIAPLAAGAVVAASLVGAPGASTARAGQAVWGPRQPITASNQYTPTADVAVDAAGNTTAVWSQDGVVQAARRPAGGAWGTPVPIGDGCGPQVGAAARGGVTVVWECGPEGRVMSASRPLGGGWSDPVAVSEPSAADGLSGALYPRLAVSRGGAAVVSWWYGAEDDVPAPPVPRAEAAYRPAGGGWSAPHLLGPAGEDNPAVAIDARGNVTAAFLDPQSRVRAVRRVVGRGWSSPVRISADRPQAGDVEVAVDARGDATALWQLDGRALQAASRPLRHRWSAPASLSSSGDWAAGMDDAGTALVVEANALGRISVRSKPLNRPWGPQKTIVRADGSTRSNLQLDLNADRDALVSWGEWIGNGDLSDYSSYRPRGGPWGSPQRFADSWEPATALYRNGNAVAVWAREVLSNPSPIYRVWARTMRAPR